MPDGRAAIIKTLAQYAKTEKARPAAERFKAPVLNEVQAVVDGLTANVNARRGQGPARGGGAAIERNGGAAAGLVASGGGANRREAVWRQGHARLTQWGFEVVAKKPTKKKPAVKAA